MPFSVRKSPIPLVAPGKELSALSTRFKVPSAASTGPFAPGSLMTTANTGGGVEAAVTATQAWTGWVYGIYDAKNRVLDYEYVASAPGVDYFVDLLPAGGIDYEFGEDGDTTPMADDSVGQYVSLIVSTPTDLASTSNVPIDRATPNIVIDSTSVASSASGAVQWLVVGCTTPAVYSATGKRNWRLRLNPSAATYSL